MRQTIILRLLFEQQHNMLLREHRTFQHTLDLRYKQLHYNGTF